MNAIKSIQKIVPVTLVLVLGFVNTRLSFGADPVIHAAWDGGGTPILNQDYRVFTTGQGSPDFPSVELVTGNLTWRLWSKDIDNPGDVGDIGTITSPNPQDFGLKIEDDTGGPGARTVKGITLVPSNGGNFSRITGGGMTGDLTGDLTLVQDSTGAGGEITGFFTINGDVSGDIQVPVISGTLDLKRGLNTLIHVTDKMNAAARLFVRGSVESTAVIRIADMLSNARAEFAFPGPSGPLDFAGDLILDNGVPGFTNVVIHGETTSTATVDLTGHDMVGFLSLLGGGSGSILNGGAINAGRVLLADGGATFSGRATFSGMSGGGRITTENGADLSGQVHITGDVDGTLGISVAGDFRPGGDILVDGSLFSPIAVAGDVAGDIDVGQDVTGTIAVGGSLKSTGRILIDGLCDGPVTIGKDTGALSQIRTTVGLGTAGSITVNDSEGNFDANGDIYVGQPGASSPPLPPVVFDGFIRVEKGSTGGGDLNGGMKIVGCHATSDDLDICICGSVNGFVVILQTGCPNQVTLTEFCFCPA